MGSCCITQGTQPGLCNDLDAQIWGGGEREVQEEGYVCILTVDSPWCMTETNTT